MAVVSEQTWSEFRQEVFGDPYLVWHDGADFGVLSERVRTAPAEVERLLLAGLAEGDGLAAESMSELEGQPGTVRSEGSHTRYVTALESALPASVGSFRVEVAKALIALTGSEEWSSALVDVLVGGGTWGDRLDAAMAIGDLKPTVALIGALMVGINDGDYLVRYHSGNAMRKFAGNADDISSDPDLFAKILDGTPPSGWKQVAAELSQAAAARLGAG